MEKEATSGEKAAATGSHAAIAVMGSSGSMIDFSCTCLRVVVLLW